MAEETYQEILQALVIDSARNADNMARMERYHEALFSENGKDALAYLKNERGFVDSTIRHFRMGYVADPFPIDRFARGYISIPYLNPAGVFDIRFRKLPTLDEKLPKYWQPAGSTQTIFNVQELDAKNRSVVIGEGELTAVMAYQVGIPAVAYPGVESVKQFHRHLYEGFERVYICGDGDEAGMRFTEQLADMLSNARPVYMPDGEDLDSFCRKHGAEATRKLIFGDEK